MTDKVYRQEIKKILPSVHALMLEQRIAAILPKDGHAGADGSYHIRSIYFDTINDTAYHDKLTGISEREKFRIRFYDFNTDTIKLERKEKRENLIYKDVMTLRREDAEQLMQGNFEVLLSYEHPLAAETYSKAMADQLKPVVVVDYLRKAYIYPAANVRITFDSHLQSRSVDGDILTPGALYDVLGNDTILEIKFDKYLPEHIRQLICSVNGQQMALSKYMLCRDNLKQKQGIFF